MIIAFILAIVGIALICFGVYSHKERKKTQENFATETTDTLSKCLPIMSAKYSDMRRTLNIPSSCPKIDVETTVFGFSYSAQAPAGKIDLLRKDFYCWEDNGELFIFPTEDHITSKHITYANFPDDIKKNFDATDLRIIQINRSSIQYYRLSGQERTETKVRSQNDGVNVKGAIVGGLIGGDAGAIIGSSHNKGQIYSYTEKFDDRYVELLYTHEGKVCKLKLSIPAYPLLEQWFPEKDYEYVISSGQATPNTSDKFEEIKKYKDLLDSGIISNAEYEAKRKELLGL